MKRLKKRFTAFWLMIVCVLCFTFVGCDLENLITGGSATPKTEKELIEERIETFVDAYNDGDWNTIMDCLERKVRLQFEAIYNLMGGILGGATGGYNIDFRDLFTLGIGVMSEGDVMAVTIENIQIQDDAAIAVGRLQYVNPVAIEGVDCYVLLVKEKEGWKIKDLTDKKPNVDFGDGEDASSSL